MPGFLLRWHVHQNRSKDYLLTAKQTLRRAIRDAWSQVSPEDRVRWTEEITREIVANRVWTKAREVLVYQTMHDEIDTASLISESQATGKSVFVPAYDGDQMWFHRIEAAGDVWAPSADGTPKGALVICPGRAFDARGNRLGRGKGYYDRFLGQFGIHCFTIGIGAPFQLVSEVPAGENDVRLDAVCTPLGDGSALRFIDSPHQNQ